MNSRMNFGGGFSVPQENEFQIRGSWIPATPDKPIPARSHSIPVERQGNQLERDWQEFVEISSAYLLETPNYNEAVQNFNPNRLVDLNRGGLCDWGVALADDNRQINHIANPYAQSLRSNCADWNNDRLADFLAIKNAAASMASENSTPNRSIHVSNRPLIPNLHSQLNSNWRDSNTQSFFPINNNNCLGSSLWSNNSLSQIPQCGFPVPYRPNYNLNSPPRTETDAASSVTSSFPFAPVTPDQVKKPENKHLSDMPTLSVDETLSHEKDKPDNLVTSIGNEAIENHCDELLQTIVDSSSAAISTPSKEKNEDKICDEGIDLNKTPQQKTPKRRKHRPKVVIEGKPKRGRKPATPQNPNKENPSGKRKYVRKKGIKTSTTPPADATRETTNPTVGTAANSCRRALNFDLEKTDDSQGKSVGQPEETQHGILWALNLNSDYQNTELCNRADSMSGTKSAVRMGHVMVENQQAGTTSNLTHSMNQMPTDYISLPERHAPLGPQAATMNGLQMKNSNVIASDVNAGYADPSQNICKNGYTPVHQRTHAEGIGQIVKQLMLQSSPHSVPKHLVDSNEARGSKRGYCHTIEQTHPRTLNLMNSSLNSQGIFQGHEYNSNGSNFGNGFSQTRKKNRAENGLYTNMPSIPSVTAVEGGSRQVKMNGRNEVNADQFTSQINHRILNSYFESTNTPKKQNNGFDKSTSDWYNPSTAAVHNFPKQQNSSDLLSYTARMEQKRSNGSTRVHDFSSLTTIEKCNMLPLTPTKRAPTCGDGRAIETYCTNRSAEKQMERPNISTLISSSTDKVLQQGHKEVKDYQQSSMRTKGPSEKQKYPIPIDEIICQMKALNLNGRSNEIVGQQQNALVPYKGDGTIIPYEGFDHIRKRKPRPKVDLDPETNRIWKLLMGKEANESDERTDKDKEKWWEEERNVFRGRADSFIARMHLVQGDRRFSQWKGSVVDSVIGVFLTQNVSDHLSSSAFMSLAARFPFKSSRDERTRDYNGKNVLVEEPEVCILVPEETIGWCEKVPSQPVYNQSSMISHESLEHRRDSLTSGIQKTTLEESNYRRVEEEVISSLDSSILQANGGIRSCSRSSLEAEDPSTGYKHARIHGSASRNLLQMEKTAMFQEFHSHGSGRPQFDESFNHGHKQTEDIAFSTQKPRLDRVDNLKGSSAFTYPVNSNNPNRRVPIVPSSSYRLNMNHGHKQTEDIAFSTQKPRLDRVDNLKGSSAFTYPVNSNNPNRRVPIVPSSSYRLHMTPDSGVLEVLRNESISSRPFAPSGITRAKDVNWSSKRIGQIKESNSTVRQNGLLRSQEKSTAIPNDFSSNFPMHQQSSNHPGPLKETNQYSGNHHQHERSKTFQLESTSDVLAKRQSCNMSRVPNVSKLAQEAFDVEERISVVNKQTRLETKVAEPNSKEQDYSSSNTYSATNTNTLKAKKGKVDGEKKNTVDWDSLRKQVLSNTKRERNKDKMDSLDYERMRCADVDEISNAIKERGMNNMLAERIKDFLNRLVREHGGIDLEWLRDAPPDKAKDYLLSIRGLGLKSVECVRLLTLHHLAFPVDTNVGRIAVRLGWVPLQPLPESLQLHLLELYPVLESIQKYLWPRLCKMDQRTLYELHYQMITFGKVFCTKNKPNCNACPMRGECRHFASAFASARLALPGPEEKSIVNASVPITAERNPAIIITPMPLPLPGNNPIGEARSETGKCEPIIEVPATPEPECPEISESDIEDAFYEDPDEIPTIKLNIEEFTLNLQNYMQENNLEVQDGDMSKALVALNPEAASIPTQKLKNVSRLRTEHQVYELPDSHPLLNGLERREPDDPSPYLLAIWTPGETANSTQPPERLCGLQDSGKLCNEKTCFSCNSVRESNSQTVRGTLLIPCRTAMRGSFPLNGTYFQVNEMFADHDSSLSPIDVPREWLWNLPRRTVYFGTSVSSIFKGLSTEGIQYCFWRGFVCVRGFDLKSRAPRPLMARLHFPASKLVKTKNEMK